MKIYINKIHYAKDLNLLDLTVKNSLKLLSIFYGAAVDLKNWAWENELFKKKKLSAYVISVGNLTTGGTGKTPITAAIAEHFIKNGKKTAILSRGYGGHLSSTGTNIISDGKNIFYNSFEAGDEPYWMASNINKATIITGANRYNSGTVAINEYGCEVLVLDDGFQHIKLERDLNLLVIDSYKKFGNELVLPAGPLREPLSEIDRADKIILVNKKPFDEIAKKHCVKYAEELYKTYKKPVVICETKTEFIYNVKTKENIPENQKVYAFAGIAQPEFFFLNLKQEGFNIVEEKKFKDHYVYSALDLKNIIDEAKSRCADCIITTEKDAVKLSAYIEKTSSEIPIFALKLGLDIDLKKLFDEGF